MDLIRPYYNRYSPNLPPQHQYPVPSRSPETNDYFPTLTLNNFEQKNPEMYDVNTFDSFVSTNSDQVSSLSDPEHYDFNFFSLKRSQFKTEREDEKPIGINQEGRKNPRGMYRSPDV